MTCPECQCLLLPDALNCSVCGTPVRRPPPPVRYGGFWRRVAAVLIDIVVIWPALVITVNYCTDLTSSLPVDDPPRYERAAEDLAPADNYADVLELWMEMATFGTTVFFTFAPYYILTESSALQGTFGKRVMGLRVVDLNGNRIRILRATGRYFARLLSATPWMLGFVMAGFTTKKQTLHDKAAGTTVIITKEDAVCSACGMRTISGADFCHRCGKCLLALPSPVRYGGFWRRVFAVLIDIAFLAVPVRVLMLPLPSDVHQQTILDYYTNRVTSEERQEAVSAYKEWAAQQAVLVFILFSIYFTATESSGLEGTLGKRVLGLRVTDLDGRRVRLGRAFARCLARALSAVLWHIGFVMAAFTTKKQTLHDVISDTVVVVRTRDPQPTSLPRTV